MGPIPSGERKDEQQQEAQKRPGPVAQPYVPYAGAHYNRITQISRPYRKTCFDMRHA